MVGARVHCKHVKRPFPVNILTRLAYLGTDTPTASISGTQLETRHVNVNRGT